MRSDVKTEGLMTMALGASAGKRRIIRFDAQLDRDVLKVVEFQHHSISVVVRDLLRRGLEDFWEDQEHLKTKGGVK